MLSPEVINFSPPRVLLQSINVKDEECLVKLLSSSKMGGSHYHGVTVILPNSKLQDTDDLFGVYEEEVYYQVDCFPVHGLLDPNFLASFIKSGNLQARTLVTWSSVDNCAVLDAAGILNLSVTKDVYQELGLTGEPDLILGKQIAKYKVTIDLLDTRFTPDGKFYQRVLSCLKRKSEDFEFNWLMRWNPAEEETCPSSLAAYLDIHGFRVTQCLPRLKHNELHNVRVPTFSSEMDLNDLIEWIGTAALQIECPAEESYASSLICPEPHTISENVTSLRWTGFFGNQEIKVILKQLLQLKQGWVNITIHGFDESAPTGIQQLCSIFLRSSGDHCVVTCKSPTNIIK